MYVSEIHFNLMPDDLGRVLSRSDEVIERLRQVPGCRQLMVLRTAVDRVTSYVVYDTYAQAEAATALIADFFARVAPFLTLLPQREIYPAVLFEQFPAKS